MQYTLERPTVPLVPATISISTETPDAGWWIWTMTLTQESYRAGAIVPFEQTASSQATFHFKIQCSAALDPIPDLHMFLRRIYATADTEWSIDEEGRFVTLHVWYLNYRTIHLRIFSNNYETDYCHDFVLDRDVFLKQLGDAYYSFGKYGGWGDYGDYAAEDDFPGPAVMIAE